MSLVGGILNGGGGEDFELSREDCKLSAWDDCTSGGKMVDKDWDLELQFGWWILRVDGYCKWSGAGVRPWGL